LSNRVKIRFPLVNESASGETLWAEGAGENLFTLLNIPFLAVGYAEGDVVRCVEHDGWHQVVGLEHSSGNGTLRLIFTDGKTRDAQEILDELSSVGCTYERASRNYVAVTVPPNLQIPFSQLSNYLNQTTDEVLTGWEVAKPFDRGD